MTLLGRISTIALVTGALASGPTALAQSGVDVEVDQFGLNMFRPGGIVPLLLKLTSNLDKPAPIWVQWQVANADGDMGEYGRSLTVSPGQPAYAWLYAPIAPGDSLSSVYTVRVFEERDGERRGEVGGRRISPADAQAQLADLAAGMIAIIGDRRMSLEDYGIQTNMRLSRPISANEDTRLVSNLKPAQLPDRWYGLLGLEAIAWAGDNVPPQDLSIDQADALRDYVQRGGHLIISLPAAGNPWGLGAPGQTLLEDLLPCRTNGVTPRRDEAVTASALLSVMCKTKDIDALISGRREPEFTIRVFKDLRGEFNVIDNGFEPLLALADGRVVVVQKRVGFGCVTVSGIDLADGRLASLGLPHADVFWSRVLGRRADTPTISELQAIEKAERLARSYNDTDKNMGSGLLFSSGIHMVGTAGAGLLLAFIIFVAYWCAATFSFVVLKHYQLTRHAWLAFAGCAALFTLLAWGSVGLIPQHMEVQHVTVLDHIARPPESATPASAEAQYQRAVSFFSLYLPRYGFTEVALERSGEQRDLLLPWTPPGEVAAPFPNTDTFRVDVGRSFARYALPSRSTTTQLYAHWMGGVDPDWGGLLRADPTNPPRVVKGPAGTEDGLAGAIISDLPGTLTDVKFIWVKSNRVNNRTYGREVTNERRVVERPWVQMTQSGSMLNVGSMWAKDRQATWSSGEVYNLAISQSGLTSLELNLRRNYLDPFEGSRMGYAAETTRMDSTEQRRYLEMMSVFHQLQPPEYLAASAASMAQVRDTVSFHRELARELDLSTWFTRPCLIVIGYLEGSALPIPVRLDGRDEPPASRGLTMIRWIYPLPVDEQIAFPPPEPPGIDDEPDSDAG